MISTVQQNIENGIYESLKKGNVGKTLLEKYKNQSIEELARIMTEGYKASWIAKVVKNLDSQGKVVGFEAMCNAAFEGAMLRLLKEAQQKIEKIEKET